MSINNKLITLAQQELVLSHDETERNKINASLEHLKQKLRDNFGNEINEFIPFGSFTRNTILPRKFDPESDVDLMVVFNTDIKVFAPGVYRQKVSEFIKKAYPNSLSQKDFPVVKLSLNHIIFDIVPSYSKSEFFTKYHYIPGSGDTWIPTTPNDINNELESLNQSLGRNAIRNAIRLCKYWNAISGYPFQSYLMEKRILKLSFWGYENTYDCFLYILKNLSSDRPSLVPILNEISRYKGIMYNDEAKQMEQLQKLLPVLK